MRDWRAIQGEMMAWRHELHANPEFGFEEKRTAAFVAAKLRTFGMDEVVEGVGGTGVVATLTRGKSNRAIALRADMDALRITEQAARSYSSTIAGTMHACGHDGHTAMLLGAAKTLAEDGGFDGTVRFIFQPAEEWGKGALAMIEDGLLERFPFEEIYGLHNMPGYPVGEFRTRVGALMLAEDNFEIVLKGVGGHASRPHSGQETMVAGAALVMNLQTIVSRRLDPTETAVVSVTEFITDGTRNVLPGTATRR
jgi:hippurate hydrolase